MPAEGPDARRWRLAAILAADVAGSSLPVSEDEVAALPPKSGP